MEVIDGWEVDDRQGFAKKGPTTVGAPDASYQYLTVDIRGRGIAPVDIPARVARILLGDRSADPQSDLDAATMTNEEGAEIIAELLGAVAALTGTELEGCAGSCAGHPSPEAWSQVRCSEVGQVAPGALPWRPAVGERCFYFLDGEWRHVVRIENCRTLQCFEMLDGSGMQVDCDATFTGIRPLGSLPVPASARKSSAVTIATDVAEGEPTILVEPPGRSAA